MCKLSVALITNYFIFILHNIDIYKVLYFKRFDTDDIAATCAKNASAAAKEGLKDLVQVFLHYYCIDMLIVM